MLRFDLRREHGLLSSRYATLAATLAWPGERLHGRVTKISRWSPAQQISHILLVNISIFEGLRRIACNHERAVENENRRCRPLGSLVLALGRIPRGRGKSPEPYKAEDEPDKQDLERRLAANREECSALESILPNLEVCRGRFPHPVFGMFKAAQWMRLARIHTDHHLTIVRDTGARLKHS